MSKNEAETLTFHLKGWTTQPGYARHVFLNGRNLRVNRGSRRLDVMPNEVAWGYGGTGPRHLAKIILAALKGDKWAGNPLAVSELVSQVISRVAAVDQAFEGDYTFVAPVGAR